MKYLMCNLKSNKSLKEILDYKSKIVDIKQDNIEFVLFPSNLYLSFFYNSPFKIGAQNISKHATGSHTGEELADQLISLKVSYVIINHCEMEETNESIIAKIKNATSKNIKVVLCIGKEISENETNIIEVLKSQIKEIFINLSTQESENIILAFEPCWAINKDDIIDTIEISQIAKKIKNYVEDEYNIKMPFLYGGSIKVENVEKLLNIDILDGYLIGNCANNPENILEIVKKI